MTKWNWIGLGVLVLILAGAMVYQYLSSHIKVTPAQSEYILAQISQIAETRPSTVASLSQMTGVAIKQNRSESNQYYSMFQGTSSEGYYKEVELRLYNVTNGKTKGGLLISLVLEDNSNIYPELVRSKFGQENSVGIPSAEQGSSGPTYYVYERSWGNLKFGFDKNNKLISVIIDSI